MHYTHQSEIFEASLGAVNSQQGIAFGAGKTDTTNRLLVALHYNAKDRCITFRYKVQRWDIFESLRLWDIPEAFKISLERIEEAKPGALAKAADLDDKDWQSNKRRTRRYIAESPDLLYINSPTSKHSQKASLATTFSQTFRGVMSRIFYSWCVGPQESGMGHPLTYQTDLYD